MSVEPIQGHYDAIVTILTRYRCGPWNILSHR
jgi:hypothetical protein